MTLFRLSPTPTFDDIEAAYRAFLRKTWITLPAVVAIGTGIVTETGVFVYPDGLPKRPDLYNDMGILYFALIPLMYFTLTFVRGRKELRTIAFGRLAWWQIAVVGVSLGTIAQVSGRVIFPLFGGSIISANDDPSMIGTIMYFLFTVFLTVVSEEVMFRVVLQTYLQRYGSAIAIIGTAAIFTLFHFAFFDRIPAHDDIIKTFVLIPIPAIILSVARRYSGSLLLTLTIHATANCLGIFGRHSVAQLPGCC